MLKYFLRLTALITFLGFLFRAYFIYYFRDEAGRLLYAWVWGLRFDVAIAVVFAATAALLSLAIAAFKSRRKPSRKKWSDAVSVGRGPACFFVCFTLVMLIGDALFFLDSGRHVTYEAKSFFISFTEILRTGFKTPPLSLIAALAVLPFLIWRGMPRFSPHVTGKKDAARLAAEFLAMLLIGILAFRGGLGGVPQNPSFSYKLGDTHKSIVAMNGAYGFFHGFLASKNTSRVVMTPPPKGDARKIVEEYLRKTKREDRPLVKANVIYVLLEGWPARIIKSYGGPQDTVPFYESLRKKSLTTDITFAGGLRTTEGIFANFCAWVNPLGRSIAKSQLESQPYHCLPQILREHGWSSAFFQGTTKETSGTGELAQRLGFEFSYGKYEVPGYDSLPKNDWGLFDRDIYKFVLKKTTELKEPFIVGINTNTTHSIEIPPDDPKTFGCEDFASCFLSAFASADRDLGKFFDDYGKLKHEYPTIWVLLADHTSKHEQRSRIDGFRIPMLIYAPEFFDKKFIDSHKVPASTQRDVGITVAHLLGVDTSEMLGRSLLDPNAPTRSEYFHQGVLGWLIDGRVFEVSIDSGNVIGCYDWRKDTAQKNDILATDKECHDNRERAQGEALAIINWSQEKLFSGTIGKP